MSAPRTLARGASVVSQTPPLVRQEIDLKKIFKELDIEIMKAMASLLRGLSLQGDDANSNDPIAIERKKGRFTKYFSYFTKLLTRCKEEVSCFFYVVFFNL